MRNTTHELVGVSVALVAARAAKAGPIDTAGLACAAFYGSWLPDVDQLGSRVHRRSALERRSVALRVAGSFIRLPALVFGVVSSHRGIAHSLIAGGLVTAMVAVLVTPLGRSAAAVAGGGVGIGYASHLLADSCTPSGVQLFLPIKRARVWLVPAGFRIPTGSLRELALAALAFVTIALVLAT